MSKNLEFIKSGLTKYIISLIDMDIAYNNVLKENNKEYIIITEYDKLYSAGKSFKENDFLNKTEIPIYYTKRGGRVTVHSRGQIVIYPIINLKKRNLNVFDFVKILEDWMIKVLDEINIKANARDKNEIGVWVNGFKIGFIGIRIEKGISTHGFCLNISNDLSLYKNIVPCGINNIKVTSIKEILKNDISIEYISDLFQKACPF